MKNRWEDKQGDRCGEIGGIRSGKKKIPDCWGRNKIKQQIFCNFYIWCMTPRRQRTVANVSQSSPRWSTKGKTAWERSFVFLKDEKNTYFCGNDPKLKPSRPLLGKKKKNLDFVLKYKYTKSHGPISNLTKNYRFFFLRKIQTLGSFHNKLKEYLCVWNFYHHMTTCFLIFWILCSFERIYNTLPYGTVSALRFFFFF